MVWTVEITNKVSKNLRKLPSDIQNALDSLVKEIRDFGPVRGNWRNYGKIGSGRHHCHLRPGKPTYVAVWEVRNRQSKLVEVRYAGTHEKAPY